MAQPITLAPTPHLAEGSLSSYDLERPAPTLNPYSPALTTPCPVIPIPALAFPAPSALSPQHSTSALPNNVAFGQVIEEALPYTNMPQAPYPLLAEPLVDNLSTTENSTTKELHCAPSLLAYIS